MDKYVKAFCDDNPKFELECPECKHSETFKSKDVFKTSKFSYKCNHCGEDITVDTSKFARELRKTLNKVGIYVD